MPNKDATVSDVRTLEGEVSAFRVVLRSTGAENRDDELLAAMMSVAGSRSC
jgi:hypothetical protein